MSQRLRNDLHIDRLMRDRTFVLAALLSESLVQCRFFAN
jgi:hypothetical protein